MYGVDGNSTASGDTARASGDVFTNLYPALVQCFFIILLGYGSGRMGIFPPVMAKGLGKFLSHIILPAFLFKAMVTLNFEDVNWKFLAALLLAKGIVFFLVSVLGYVSSRPMNIGRAGIYAIFTTQSNDFAFGYPILEALYRDCHPEYLKYIYLVAPVSLVCLNPIGFFMMEYHRERTLETRAPVSKFHCIAVTLRGVLSNPIVFMTFFGVVANFILQQVSSGVPVVVDNILTVLSNAFSATALFYLGLKNVPDGGRSRVNDRLRILLVPLLLVAIKTLLLPVVAFEMVTSLNVGANSTETLEWGAFGFVYGTIPTAPAVIIYASRFSLEMETITSGLVLCTFLSAPLMFLAAKMMTLHYSMEHNMEYTNIISLTFKDAGYLNLISTVVMLVLFILGKKYHRKSPHSYTMCLLVCQIFTSLGLIISQLEKGNKHMHILVFILYFFGTYGSRCWTAMVALALYFLRCCGFAQLLKRRIAIHLFGWGFPVFCTGVALLTSKLTNSGGHSSSYKSFISEVTEQKCIGGISLAVLLISVAITVFSMLYLQRCDKYCSCKANKPTTTRSKNVLDPEIEKSLIQNRCNRCKELFDERGDQLPCEGIMPDTIGDIENLGKTCLLRCSNSSEWEGYGATQNPAIQHKRNSLAGLDRFEYELTMKEYYSGDKHQLTRHIVLLVLLVMSMVLDIAMVFWRMIDSSEGNGIYLEMNLLDGVLSYSQGFIIFFIFGFEKQYIYWPFVKRWRKLRYGVEKIKLVEERDVDAAVTHVCEQFNRYHKQRCQQNIISDKRYNFRTYKSVFLGTDLVDWLLEIGLAVDRHSAVSYGRTLLDGRVIRHIHEEHHFADLPYLYQFCQQ